MEFIIVILLIYLIFKDDIREEIRYQREKRHKKEEKSAEELETEKRKEALETELKNMMDYSINTAVDSKKR